MEIFDVFSMNEIENYPAAGKKKKENVILTDTLSQGFLSQRGANAPLGFAKGGGEVMPP